ncbi:hypothetical protein QBD00_002560 [Ochrobactrum sp. AN78]|nr:hypothetical protein [Ochrobactrum sp. AN78]
MITASITVPVRCETVGIARENGRDQIKELVAWMGYVR